MSRTARLLGMIWWLVGALNAQQVPTQVTLPEQGIVFGEAFELTVTSDRSFDAGRLLPLVVELLTRKPCANGEQWRFRARCYELGEVTLPLVPPVTLTVRTALAEPPGDLEWPSVGWQIAPAESSRWLMLGLLAMAGVVAVTWWRLLRTSAVVASVEAAPIPDSWDPASALAELSLDHGDQDAFYGQVKAIVRRHCALRFQLPADVRTSEELLVLLPKAQPTLQPCLATCDVVLFGGGNRDEQTAASARDHALRFVAATKANARRAVAVPL